MGAKHIAAAAVVIAAVVGLAWQSEVHDADETTVAEAARRLLDVDARLDRAVLESQAGLSLNYDEVAATERDVADVFGEMEAAAAHIDDVALTTQVRVARAHVRERERLVDSFESLNSVFRNSVAFLPVAAKRATALAPLGASGDLARHWVAELLEDVLICRAGCAREAFDEIGDDVSALEAAVSGLPTGDRAAFEVALRHARRFFEYAPRLHAAVRALVRMDQQGYAEIAATVSARREQARWRANYYRAALVVLCIGLVAGLIVAAGRLRRGARALEEALLNLTGERQALVDKQFELALLNQELESRMGAAPLRRHEAEGFRGFHRLCDGVATSNRRRALEALRTEVVDEHGTGGGGRGLGGVGTVARACGEG